MDGVIQGRIQEALVDLKPLYLGLRMTLHFSCRKMGFKENIGDIVVMIVMESSPSQKVHSTWPVTIILSSEKHFLEDSMI